tara:strand:+ start:2037 stop:2447 length:411 start_codon:yes stop_codon:yes gene_type:complete
MAKIKTVTAIYQSRNGDLCFISREMIAFNQDKIKKEFVSIVREEAFVINQEEIYIDGLPTGTFKAVPKVIETLRTRAYAIPYKQVDRLFNAIASDITSTEVFTERLDQLQETALLLDTQPYNLYGANATNWEPYSI